MFWKKKQITSARYYNITSPSVLGHDTFVNHLSDKGEKLKAIIERTQHRAVFWVGVKVLKNIIVQVVDPASFPLFDLSYRKRLHGELLRRRSG
jgi:hypothetical protein